VPAERWDGIIIPKENELSWFPPTIYSPYSPSESTMQKTFKLTIKVTWWMQIFQILFALPFTIGCIFVLVAVIKGSIVNMGTLFVFLLLASFAYLGWANAFSTIQITEKHVTVTVFYGRFRINWDEVENIVMNDPLIALMGNGKRLVLSLAFAGKSRAKILEFFNQQIEQRHIRLEEAPFSITHQNVRVWR
jgi:hypothetical protein